MFNSDEHSRRLVVTPQFAIDGHELGAIRPLGKFLGFGLHECDGRVGLAVGPKRDVLGLDELDGVGQSIEPLVDHGERSLEAGRDAGGRSFSAAASIR